MKLFARNARPAGGESLDTTAVRVTDSGYEPDAITVAPGHPARIAFTRETASPCAEEVTFPDLGVSAKLPVGERVVVVLPAPGAGEHEFTCGMGMLRGRLIVAANGGCHSAADDTSQTGQQGGSR